MSGFVLGCSFGTGMFTSVDGVYGGIGMPYMHGKSLLDRER